MRNTGIYTPNGGSKITLLSNEHATFPSAEFLASAGPASIQVYLDGVRNDGATLRAAEEKLVQALAVHNSVPKHSPQTKVRESNDASLSIA